MGRGHDDTDHPAMMSSPRVLPAPMVQVHESCQASNMGRCHDDVDHPAMMSLPKVLLVLADPAPKGDQFPAAPLQKMTSPNCAHGESQQNTSYIAKQDKTPCVTICNPTFYASEHERKFGVTLVNHGAKGSLAGKVHVEEGIDKHQVSDIPTLRASDVFSRTNNGREVIVSTALLLPICQPYQHSHW